MNMNAVLHFFIWCTLINYAILLIWFLAMVFAHDWFYRMHTRWFKLSVETFDAVHYGSMSIYKIGILLFNMVPLIALHFI